MPPISCYAKTMIFQIPPLIKCAVWWHRSTHDCVICGEPHNKTIRVPCGHYYDIPCLTSYFENSTKDESIYPPRCCNKTIPLALIRPHLSLSLVNLFKDKRCEFQTPNRVYCSNPKCNQFLGKRSGKDHPGHFSCKKCSTLTCKGCKIEVGRGEAEGSSGGSAKHLCDDGDRQLQLLSQKTGWARCPKCTRMVELVAGCFHIYCPCKTTFCYICQGKLGKCKCPSSGKISLAIAARNGDKESKR